MDGHQQTDPVAELAMVDHARARSLAIARPPVWADALFAAMLGASWVLGMTHQLIPVIIAVVLLVAALWSNQHFTRRKGRLLDDRATSAHMKRYFLFMAPVIAAPTLLGGGHSLTLLIPLGLVVAVLGFTYMRAETRSENKRLAAGDFKPWDLV